MADRILCCLRWRYSAFDRNSSRDRLLSSPEVQLDTTRMGIFLSFTVTSFTRQIPSLIFGLMCRNHKFTSSLPV